MLLLLLLLMLVLVKVEAMNGRKVVSREQVGGDGRLLLQQVMS